MRLEKILITPSMAADMLQSNIKNRTLREKAITKYANEMLRGTWKQDTGEVIKISKTGVLLDGQHRLMAIIKANIPVYFHVIYGLCDSITDVLDTGSNRSASDVFKLNNIMYNSTIPSMINQYNALKNTKALYGTGMSKNQKLSNNEILSMYYERPDFWHDVAKTSLKWYESFSRILNTSIIGGIYAYLYEINSNDAKEFINQLCTGNDIENKSLLVLRKKLVDDKLSIKSHSKTTIIAFILKTWVHFRKGTEISILKYNAESEEIKVI
jgi:hypothetical protein